MRGKLALSALMMSIAGVMVWATGCGEDAAPRIVPEGYYGVAGHVLRAMASNGETELLGRHLDEIEELELAFVRANLDWPELEPAAPIEGHNYDFQVLDKWVAALATRGLRWYAVGVGTPRWAADPVAFRAGCSIYSPPADPADYAAAMASIAARYGRDGAFWEKHPQLPYRPVVEYEIWNEPNLGGFWCPGPDPKRYAELVEVAATAIHGVDPASEVILGGLAPYMSDRPATARTPSAMSVPRFLATATAETELGTVVDAIGVHAYADPQGVSGLLASFRAAADASDMGEIPLSLNETGWTTQGQGAFAAVEEKTRAGYMAQLVEMATRSNCDVVSFAPHTWVTEEAETANQEHWFGMAAPETGIPYPTGEAYGRVVKAIPPGTEIASEDIEAICGPLSE